jgi:hypothetical protein
MVGAGAGECKLNDIGRETNTLISDMTTVICLDDFHSNDRAGRKVSGAASSSCCFTAPCSSATLAPSMRCGAR